MLRAMYSYRNTIQLFVSTGSTQSLGFTVNRAQTQNLKWRLRGYIGDITPVMENQMEKKMEHGMETGVI